MNDRSHDELLSAYLDGEVTAEEQARAERLLVEDRQAGRLFEQMRAIRSSLQELPRQNLPDDFSARVLRAAEREVLKTPSVAASVSEPPQLSWQERIRRPLAYASLVLAASVLIMILTREDAGEKAGENPVAHTAHPAPLAATREDKAPVAEPPAIAAAALLDKGEPEIPALGKSPATKKEALSDAEGFGSAAKFGQPAPQNKAGETLADRSSLLVVTCEITPSAARQDAFRQVLTRNSIDLGDASPAAPGQAEPTATMPKSAEGLGVDAAKAGLEVVYVEASAEQLEKTLAEMAAQPKDFLSVEVGAAETQGLQNRWQEQYSRGRSGLVQQRSLESNLATASQKPAAGPTASNPRGTAGRGGASLAPSQGEEERRKKEASAAPPANPAPQLAGRARGYAMPAEGLNYSQQAAGSGLPQQQQPVPGGAPVAANQVQKRSGDAQRLAPSRPLAEQSAAAEPANLRALFVLRVANDQPPESASPAKPADK